VTILALDLATQCGWATYRNGELRSGEWALGGRLKGWQRKAERVRTLQRMLLCVEPTPKLVVYEMPMHHQRSDEAHTFGHLEGKVLEWAAFSGLEVGWLVPSQIKKHATGNGRAKKPEMVAAANRRWRLELKAAAHNEADALCLLAAWLDGVRVGGRS
jgi:Holliday junction resolvasome RuvABC endonuclease subunit